ncbi:hypothetical protein A0H81_11446 [Grifola frondosa]|uniref:Uncharacterized protein n=1 Tax=Grifola frondosa TaxID=5627 RepID=A0A1C7LUK9_GRIFR|nr:hypothetical protein A0H81_11446 [Grifola frondosa]
MLTRRGVPRRSALRVAPLVSALRTSRPFLTKSFLLARNSPTPKRTMSTTHLSLWFLPPTRPPLWPVYAGRACRRPALPLRFLGLDPSTGKLVPAAELGKVVKTTVFLQSMDDFAVVARLPLNALFEIESIVSVA